MLPLTVHFVIGGIGSGSDPKKRILTSFIAVILTGKSATPGMLKPSTVRVAKLTTTPIETGTGLSSGVVGLAIVPWQANVSVSGSAAAAVEKPTRSITADALMRAL